MATFRKRPAALKPYGFDWAAPPAKGGPFLTDGDTIDTSTWTVSPTGELATSSPAINPAKTVTTVWCAGGVAGKTYTLTNDVVTVAGIHEQAVHTIIVET